MQTFSTVWQLEWRRALRRRRLFRLNIIIPLLLVVPIAFGGAPAVHAAAVYTVLFALFGTFGAAIPALRDAENGVIRRLTLTQLSMRSAVLGRAVAGGCIDALQLLPAVVVILAAGNAAVGTITALIVTLTASLVFANLFGLAVAAAARSVGEGALFAAVSTLLLLHASGVFRTPAIGSIGARVEMIAPYRALHELLLAVTAGRTAHVGGLWIALAVMIVIAVGSAKHMVRALARADGQG
jgi:hypothetical protein